MQINNQSILNRTVGRRDTNPCACLTIAVLEQKIATKLINVAIFVFLHQIAVLVAIVDASMSLTQFGLLNIHGDVFELVGVAAAENFSIRCHVHKQKFALKNALRAKEIVSSRIRQS